MAVRFRSKAGAEVFMLDAHARLVLEALGRPLSDEGIFTPEQIPGALAALADRIAACAGPAPAQDADATEPISDCAEVAPGLAQRAWPLRVLLEAAWARQLPVVWQPG